MNVPKLRRLRLSLKTFFAVVAACALPLAWLSWQLRAFERERYAIDYLSRDIDYSSRETGTFFFNFGSDDNGPIGVPRLEFRQLLHGRIYRPATFLSWTGAVITQAAWDQLAACSHVEDLSILGCELAPDVAFDFHELRSIKMVGIADCRLTDEQLEDICRSTSITELHLQATGVSDQSCLSIAKMTSLETLEISNDDISDAGLRNLGALSNLKALHLPHTHISSGGLAALSALPQLAELNLSYTDIQDDGLDALNCLHDLGVLALNGTNITDAGATSLLGLNQCTAIYLGDTRIGDQTVRHLWPATRLMSVDLSGTLISEDSREILGRMPCLRQNRCDLSRTNLSNNALSGAAKTKAIGIGASK